VECLALYGRMLYIIVQAVETRASPLFFYRLSRHLVRFKDPICDPPIQELI